MPNARIVKERMSRGVALGRVQAKSIDEKNKKMDGGYRVSDRERLTGTPLLDMCAARELPGI
jgi:hypothetical protein